MPTKESLSFVHRYIPRSPAQPDAPTLLVLHGTGGDENDLIPIAEEVWPGAGVLSPRGQVSESGMHRFFRRSAPGVFDVDDLKRRAADLSAFVADASEAYGFDPNRALAVGFSNGANMAAALALLFPATLAGGALFSPMMPFEPDDLGPTLNGRRFFIGAGSLDTMAPAESAERLARALMDRGADVQFRVYAMGHQMHAGEVRDAREYWGSGDWSIGNELTS